MRSGRLCDLIHQDRLIMLDCPNCQKSFDFEEKVPVVTPLSGVKCLECARIEWHAKFPNVEYDFKKHFVISEWIEDMREKRKVLEELNAEERLLSEKKANLERLIEERKRKLEVGSTTLREQRQYLKKVRMEEEVAEIVSYKQRKTGSPNWNITFCPGYIQCNECFMKTEETRFLKCMVCVEEGTDQEICATCLIRYHRHTTNTKEKVSETSKIQVLDIDNANYNNDSGLSDNSVICLDDTIVLD